MKPITENIIEQSAIDILQMQGWEYGKGIEISPKPSSAPLPDFSPCTNSFQFVPCRTNLISLPPRHLLSKSTFMMGMQCPKRLWLHKHRPEFIYNALTIGNGGVAGAALYNLKHMERKGKTGYPQRPAGVLRAGYDRDGKDCGKIKTLLHE